MHKSRSAVGALAVFFLVQSTQIHAADSWTQVGTTARPTWVDLGAERRLRMLSGIVAAQQNLKTSAGNYLGAKGPAMTAGLVLEDGLFYSQGFGYEDAAKVCAPDERTIYRPGSLSKVITGTGLLTLIDDPAMKMSLEDYADDDRYLPELKFVCKWGDTTCKRGKQSTGIKLKHLGSHTAGLADIMDTYHADVETWLTDLKKSYTLFTPGDYASYSGVATEAEGLIAQRISGKPYAKFIQENLFAPLKMTESSMDTGKLPKYRVAQRWQLNVKAASWSFSKADAMPGGDDQPMLWPAGGFSTSVRDLSRFMAMWLSANPPYINGRQILKPTTIQAAINPQVSSPGTGAGNCGQGGTGTGGFFDANNYYYSNCGAADGFGVNWYRGNLPRIRHNGSIGTSGSDTVLDQPAKIGATALISTNPLPNVATATSAQPPGLDGGFVATVTETLLNDGKNADKAPDWMGSPLAIAAARVLYLSGKTPSSHDTKYFTPFFLRFRKLTTKNIAEFVTQWQKENGLCETFRVSNIASATQMTVRFSCKKSELALVLNVESKAPYRISWSTAPESKCDAPKHRTNPGSICPPAGEPNKTFACNCPKSTQPICTLPKMCLWSCSHYLPETDHHIPTPQPGAVRNR